MSTLQTTFLKHPDAAENNIAFDSSGHATFSNTVKTSKIENASTTDGGVEIDSDGHVQVDGIQLPTGGQFSHRNLIMNGDMRIAQRGTTLSTNSGAGYKTIDRMRISSSNAVSWEYTHEQSTDATDGFSNSLKVTTTTAASTAGTGSSAFRPIEYRLEGQDIQHLQWGTSGAKGLTLSFWVKSSVTGTYGVTFYRTETTARQITRTFSVSSANTWEYKTVTIPGDTTTAVTNDNTNRLSIYLVAGAGPDSKTTDSTSWGNYVSEGFHYGVDVNLHGTVNSTIQFTGLQLEVGEKATPFEHRSYGDTLAACQRYCYVMNLTDGMHFFNGIGWNTSTMIGSVDLPVRMRARPTAMTPSGTAANYTVTMGGSQSTCTSLPVLNGSSVQSVQISFTSSGNVTVGQAGLGTSSGGDHSIIFDGGSEL